MKKNYLLSSLLGSMLLAMPVSADVIGMQTAVAVGEKISIALNEDVKATLTWGNGTSEEIVFNGEEVEIVVKDAKFTLTTAQRVTSLYCPSCALTELNIDEAPYLFSVTCPNNQLEVLNISNNPQLTDLNCANNKLKSLVVSDSENLMSLNVANNEITSMSLTRLKYLRTFICSNNQLKSLSLANSRQLETLWCQGNNLSSLTLSTSANPVQLCAFDNNLKSLKPNVLESIQELWIDNNHFTSLDFPTANLRVLSASNNELTSMTMNEDIENTLEAFYVDGNQLMVNSLPNLYSTAQKDSLVAYNIDNQRPYVYKEEVNMNETFDLEDLVKRNAWGKNLRPEVTWTDQNGKELVNKEDYKKSSLRFTFLKPFKAVYASLTSPFYPGATFKLEKMAVIDPTGIENTVGDNEVKVSCEAGALVVSTPVPTLVEIYNVSGALVVKENVSAGSSRWTLPVGLYIVNGKKVVLSR